MFTGKLAFAQAMDFLALHTFRRCVQRYSRDVDRTTGLRCDQTIRLTGVKTAYAYPQHLRRVVVYDQDNDKRLTFLTNNFDLSALTIAQCDVY